MNYQTFIGTDLKVSQICLGTVDYGSKIPKDKAYAQMDDFVAAGGNFFDTAHIYGDWVEPLIPGRSERTVGQWMKDRNCRKDIIISTKGGHPRMSSMETTRVNIECLEADLQDSLFYLQTDYIDLYFLHRDCEDVPVSTIIDWLEAQVKAGKIRYYGASNWKVTRIKEAQEYAKSKGYKGFICNQALFSLAEMNADHAKEAQLLALTKEDLAWHEETGLNIMAYMAISQGLFIKMKNGVTLSENTKKIYNDPKNAELFAVLDTACTDSAQVSAYCYQFLIQRKVPVVPISAFSRKEQMLDTIASTETEVDKEVLAKLDEIKYK